MAYKSKKKRYKSRNERYEENLKRLRIVKVVFYFILIALVLWWIKGMIGYSQ